MGIRLRYIFLTFILFLAFLCHESLSEEIPALTWTAADILPNDSGLSLLRYGAFGVGAYPYRCTLPGGGIRVRIDGVPLRSLSPFGPDLERIPSGFVGSLNTDKWRRITISTPEVTVEQPETTTGFFLGLKRRFRLNMTFQRKLNDHSGIFIGGSSAGIHGSPTIESSSSRNYLMKYIRTLKNGGSFNLCLMASRDRDGLSDLVNLSHMGHRETDDISLSIGLKDYRPWKKTSFSPLIYYNRSISRFRRYGFTRSLDDDSFGLAFKVSTQRGKASYSLDVSNDTRLFDSRIHDKFWTRNETEVTGSFAVKGEKLHVNLYGGMLTSSEYGFEPKAGGEFGFTFLPDWELVLRGLYTGEFPDTGIEYYPALVFSDKNTVSDIKAYRFSELETGISMEREIVSFGFYGFVSTGKKPVFIPQIPDCLLSDSERYSGCRIEIAARKKNRYLIDCRLVTNNVIEQSDSPKYKNGNIIWPYPEFEAASGGRLHRKLANGLVDATVFSDIRFSRWADVPVTPHGNFFFIDAGISARVKALELFYRVENITNEKMQWFNVLEWQGRNSMWGIRWKFMD